MNSTQVMESENSIESKLTQLKSIVYATLDGIISASRIVIDLIDNHNLGTIAISERTGVPRTYIENLERVGRNRLHPSLLIAETPGKLHLKSMAIKYGMPIEIQTRCLEEPVPILLIGEPGINELHTDIDSLTKEQAEQAIDKKRIRPIPEQRTWIEGFKLKRISSKPTPRPTYKIHAKKLIIMPSTQPVVIDVGELMRIVSQIMGQRLNA